jgi:glutamyl-tRNA synthetase
VVRLKNPGRTVAFTDLIRGEIVFDTKELGDFVIAKSIGEPLYHLAVVVDDFEMGVTHVIRGEDHISNTPRQILLQEALGMPRPLYAHIPLILAPDRSKLSKRHGAVAVTEYRSEGFLSQAVINFLALLGWHPEDNNELFSLDELVRLFDIKRVQRGGAVFDLEKLRWFNREHLKREPAYDDVIKKEIARLAPPAQNFPDRVSAAVPLVKERVSVLGDVKKLISEGEFSFLFSKPPYPKELLRWKGREPFEAVKKHLGEIAKLLEATPTSSFTKDGVANALSRYAEKWGRGEVLWPFRVALTGRERSPDPFTVASIIGKEEAINRVKDAESLV